MTAVPQPGTLPVLVVEDEPAVLAYIRAALERGGYRIVPATGRRTVNVAPGASTLFRQTISPPCSLMMP